ncbi:hypothetical protein DYU11_18425 [Fibrisoma montanum]|uniref:Uncharacterized protein n=1 Tax=Fibrisoma montanum TaxID=2305895 RepID=A0A418M691_9BACT|nr:hypothetical protein [Fibrisoma montanum]RIV21382.1 hypothetical protein DYU11_18425 [Fibrisoma montanum]
MATKTNPHAAPDGGPKEGRFDAWWEWEKEREQERRDALTTEERDQEDKEARQIRRRRASELS